MFHRRRKIGVAGVAAVAATALLAAGCGSSTSGGGTNTGSVKGAVATLPIVTGTGANCIYPFTGTQCYSVANYEDFEYQQVLPLYMFGGNSNTSVLVNYPLSPAEAPVYKNHGKTVVITLKPWKWSDGSTVNAKDLILDLNMLEAEKANFAGYPPGPFPENLPSHRPPAQTTVPLNLTQAYATTCLTQTQLAPLT